MKDLLKLFNQDQSDNFNSIKAGLASAQQIRSWSFGEVKKTRDNKLQNIQARKRWFILCKDFRSGKRLRMHLWKI